MRLEINIANIELIALDQVTYRCVNVQIFTAVRGMVKIISLNDLKTMTVPWGEAGHINVVVVLRSSDLGE